MWSINSTLSLSKSQGHSSQNRKRFALPFKIYNFIHASELTSKTQTGGHHLLNEILTWLLTVCDINFKFLGFICKTFTIWFCQDTVSFQLRQECCMLAFKTSVGFPGFGFFFLFLFGILPLNLGYPPLEVLNFCFLFTFVQQVNSNSFQCLAEMLNL